MLCTLENVRANIRNRDGKRVYFLREGDRLTSEARDFLNRERIEIRPASQAPISRYRLLCGAETAEKPEHMTHLHADVLVLKTHPRIAFRGAMDTLEAELLLCTLYAPALRGELEEILALARKIVRWEVMEEPAQSGRLLGLTPEELRRQSQDPQRFCGQPHFMPAPSDGPALLWVNRCRCAARSAELAAARAFVDTDGQVSRGDLLQVLNRMSSALYLLMIRLKKENG